MRGCRDTGTASHEVSDGRATLGHVLFQRLEVVLYPVKVIRDEVCRVASGAGDDDGALCVRVPADAVSVGRLADVASKAQLEAFLLSFGLLGRCLDDGSRAQRF